MAAKGFAVPCPARVGAEPPDVPGRDLLSASVELPEYAFTHCYNGVSVRSLDTKLIKIRLPRRANLPRGSRDGTLFYDLRDDPWETLDLEQVRFESVARAEKALVRYVE